MKTNLTTLLGAALLAAPLALFAPQAAAQSSQPHAEDCMTWGYMRDARYAFGGVNMCEQPVHVWFMMRGSNPIDATVDANTVFSSGITRDEYNGNWIAATCREGYEPNTPFTVENWDAILRSDYRCVRRRR